MNKETILNEYVILAKKLGKMPSKVEANKYICSYRQLLKSYKNLGALRAEALNKYPDLEIFTMPLEVKAQDIEDFRLKLEKTGRKKQNSKLVKNVSTLDFIEKFADKVFSGRVKAKAYKSEKQTRRHLNVVLSDLHFGADVDGSETGNLSYGKKEEARRLAQIVKEVCSYKLEHRDETELNVLLLGDIIQGMLNHDPRDGAELAEQYCRGLHLLLQALTHFSASFKKVNVYCATGNHDRNITRHPGRAVHSKHDSFATMIYYSLKAASKNLTNITFDIPRTPHVIATVGKHKFFAWHGDTGINVGNVGKNINISNIEQSINKVNASLRDQQEYSVFICGHLHLGTISFLPNGTTLIVNGGLPPVDSYGIFLGIHEANSGQMMFETVDDFAVGDVRFIRLSADTDKDKTLEEIIEPWTSL